MFEIIKNWLNDKFSTSESAASDRRAKTGTHSAVRPKRPIAPRPVQKVIRENKQDRHEEADKRNKFVREDTGTHETLKIIDSSLEDSPEEGGIDPYNTGAFDPSKTWNNRSRK
jgi:hypothetical protein